MNKLLEGLENFDYNLFRMVNDMHSPMMDDVMWWISYKYIWIPLYLLLIFFFFRTYGWKGALAAVIIGVVAVGLSDLIATHGFKNNFQRLRPTHNLDFKHLVHTVRGYKGGQYGFVSGHAATSFAIAVYAGSLLRKKVRAILLIMVVWALAICYSRVYLGVHYPADVACGGILGGTIGYLFAILFKSQVAKRLES